MARDIIVFGEDWGGLPSSTQHLIKCLAPGRKILWVNSIGLRRPQLNIYDVKRAFAKLAKGVKKSTANNQPSHRGFRVINPRALPVPRTRIARRLSREILARQVNETADEMGLQKPLVWTSLPTAVDLCGHLKRKPRFVYYCCDDFSSLAGVDHKVVAQRERELLDKADLIVASSEQLARRSNPAKTRLLPHGVNYELFSTPAPRAVDLPDDGRPIAGFYGSISNWLDLGLLTASVARLPQWHFVFVGKQSIDASALHKYHNVHFLGERDHQTLPSYSQHWTVSLLPFVDNAQIHACNPLKLREYLATGRPVISTHFPALEPYRKFVQVINSAGSLISALEQSRHRRSSKDQQQAVSSHTWSARAAELDNWLAAL